MYPDRHCHAIVTGTDVQKEQGERLWQRGSWQVCQVAEASSTWKPKHTTRRLKHPNPWNTLECAHWLHCFGCTEMWRWGCHTLASFFLKVKQTTTTNHTPVKPRRHRLKYYTEPHKFQSHRTRIKTVWESFYQTKHCGSFLNYSDQSSTALPMPEGSSDTYIFLFYFFQAEPSFIP